MTTASSTTGAMIDAMSASLPPPRAMPGNSNALWVPTESVACHLVTVPAVARSKWQAMIPWLLEDQLLEPAQGLVFQAGERQPDGRVPVLVASRERLAAWQRAGAGECVPDCFALPWHAGECAVALLGERAVLRHGQWQGAAGPAPLIWALVENCLSQGNLSQNNLAQSNERLVVYVAKGETLPSSLPASLKDRARVADLAGLFERPLSPWLGFAGVSRSSNTVSLPRSAWITLSLSLLALLLFMLGIRVETGRMEAQADHLDGQLREAYAQYFGADYDFPMADFQRVVSRQLEAGIQPDTSPLSLVRELAAVLPACDDCRIERLSADADGLELVLSGSADSLAKLPLGGDGWSASLTGDNDHSRYQILRGAAHE